MIKVFVTDDHELYLEGLCLLLKKQQGIEVVGSCLTAAELLSRLPATQADILLLDVHLPDMNEEELLQKIRQIKPNLKVLYLTMMRGTRYIHKLTRHTLQGYLLKNAGIDELRTAITTIANGGTYYSKEINIAETSQDFRNTITIDDKQVNEILSKRELEILKLICKEYSNAEIAEKLFLSISTVETHRNNCVMLTDGKHTVGLVKFALKNNLIE